MQPLCKAERLFRRGERNGAELVRSALAEIHKEPLAQVESVKLCDAETLEQIEVINGPAVLALAARLGKARLIDNRIFRPE